MEDRSVGAFFVVCLVYLFGLFVWFIGFVYFFEVTLVSKDV